MFGLGWQELVILTILLVYSWVGYWLYHDARRRGMNGIAWVFAWLLFNLPALVIYLIVRPPQLARSETDFG